jgi:O-antigen/teichoic acid export membrane protein
MTALQRNVVYNVVGQGLVLVLAFIAVKFIYGRLGQDVYGIIIFSQLVAVLVTNALELGISSTIVREVSSHIATEPDYVGALIRTAGTFYWTAGALIVLVIFFAAPFIVTHWINLTSADPGTAANMIRILSITAAVALPKVLYGSVFRGLQRMVLNNSIDVGQSALQQLGVIVLLSAGIKSIGIAWWIAASAMIAVGAYALIAGRVAGWGNLLPAYSPAVVRRNLRFTGHMTSISILTLIQTQADKVIVSKFLSVADLGLYGFASTTVSRATFVTTAVSQAAFPALAQLFKAGDRSMLINQYRKLQDAISFAAFPLFAAIVFAARPAFTYVFGSAGAQKLLLPTAFLCLGYFMNAALTMPYVVSLAVGKPSIASRLNLVALVLVTPVTLLLILAFGLPGAGFSWVFYHLVAYAYMVPRVCRECLQLPVAGWFLQFGKALGIGAVAYGLAWIAIARPAGYSTLALALAYVAASAVFLGAAYLAIGPELKLTVRRLPGQLMLGRTGSHG